MHPKLEREKFLVRQKHMSWMKSKYYVFDEDGNHLFYVERPAGRVFTPGHITIFEDDTATTAVLTLKQVSGFGAIQRQFELVDADGSSIARFNRHNIKSWFRRHWQVLHHDGSVIAHAREDSPAIAALRRIFEWVPYVSIVVGFIRTNFHLSRIDEGGNEVHAGTFNRKFSIGDKYALDLSDDRMRLLDRRIALALGILLDTGEAR